MCGIVGVLARRPAAPLILAALKRLEYRGYDSAGVATLDEGGAMRRLRAPGKLDALVAAHDAAPLPGTTGMGHTRWATHGAPTEVNAHPHRVGAVAVVHNGIIENFRELRGELVADGAVFESETDTEVVAQLCAREMRRGLGPTDAAAATLKRLRGAFALCFLFEGATNLLVCARRGPPLAIGYGDGEMFVGSDALALAPLTTRIAYLEDGDWAAVTRDGAHVFDERGQPVVRAVRNVAVEPGSVDKGGHRHFMAKEIHEQPATAAAAVAQYVSPGRDRVLSPAASLDWAGLERVTLVACGTAFYACQVAKWWFETVARLPAEIDVASEFRYREPPLPARGAAVFVSQSGETADTLAALRYARSQNQTILTAVNVETSSMAREADVVLPLYAGPEIGVASTKAFTGQLIALAATAILAARARGAVDAAEEARLVSALCAAPAALADAISREADAARVAAEIARARDVLYLGRGPMHALAMEGALKLKELTYIHAEGYPAGELKHGPIALVDERTPVIVLAPTGPLSEKTLSNMHEVMARKGRVALISDAAGCAAAGEGVWRMLEAPAADPFIAPIVYAAPVQLLAYHAAVARGTDVDQPRNLAKSVTVE
ncbi:glutamine--fructose-6-phosphate transaminase (isomerizing) [Rubrimonas cliftonensis]|uniref:Glutamine--fructose-6-phosphate aminotransferase [isomerizing] n=1 Tax=Rubrimonas cliftonensis TaxID=89524 RepID=A0A1H4CT60_9RHOB|nr:glutamine--fructose-6-phosphate transaminase (isomerizing) [Rubrimonas cliftonensis]SEA63521.1 glutamine--fructose-6-phosphate transaminase [Rubrimonas cliftonensis]